MAIKRRQWHCVRIRFQLRMKEEEKLAIILGTEGEGLMPQTIKQSDYTIKIPMAHGVDSLNVAAASAVAFWELGNKEVKR